MLNYEFAFSIIYEIADYLSSCSDEQGRLAGIAEILENRLGMTRVTLLILSASGEELVLDHTPEMGIGKNSGVEYRKGEGVIGRVLETGNTKVVPLISEEPAFLGRIHNRGEQYANKHGFICVPIKFGNETVGALSADIPRIEQRCLNSDSQFLQAVAGILAHDVKLRRQSALVKQALEQENRRILSQYGMLQPENIIGNSDKMREIYSRVAQVAPSNTTVLIRGESGTGKELVASAIHYNSSRKNKPFVKVNCAALSETLLESELFGHKRGAFTGAVEARRGRLAEADGGTLFLDEIGDFSPAIQVKLLRLLQEREYSVVGENEVRKADVRFVCATNRDLEKAVEDETFRQDLYYRINVFPVFLPPLRERREDILSLANHFVERYSESMNKEISRISTTAIDLMMRYDWPGNVRELENCVQHAVLVCRSATLQGSDLPPTLAMPSTGNNPPKGTLTERVEMLELDMISDSLKRNGGNVAASARELGITSRMVRYKIQKYNINLQRYISPEEKR